MFVIIDLERKLFFFFNKNLIWDRFFKDYVEKMYKLDIVKVYLLSFRNFCFFVRIEELLSVIVNVDMI